jgi:hypothetical protein
MDKPENSQDPQARRDDDKLDPRDMVPAAGKHPARPSEAEQRETLHEYPQTDEAALRREGQTGADRGEQP